MLFKLRSFFSLLLVSLVLLNGCTDDDSADPEIPGSDRDKFTGSWLCKETVTGNPPNTFTIDIQKHGADDTLFVYNFNNLGASNYVVWLISGNSVTIPFQNVTQIEITGSGLFNNGKINLNYSSDGDQVAAVCSQ